MESQQIDKPRSGFSKVRMSVGVFLAVLLASVGIGVNVSPSNAHTGDLKVSAVCNTTTGNYDLTATLTTSSIPNGVTGSSKWRIGTTQFQGTPSSDTGMDRGPVSSAGNTTVTLGSWTLPGTTTGLGPWVYAHTTWSNGTKRGSDGRLLSELKGDCKPQEEPKVTICHRTASYSTPYVVITVARSAVDGVAGNSGNQPDHYGEHQGPIFYPTIPQGTEWGDIIPPVAGAHNGYNWTAQGQAVYNNGCNIPDVKVTPVADKLDPPSCTMPGKLSIFAQPAGVIVRVNGNVVNPPWSTSTPGTYAVAYSAAEHYVLSNNPSRTVEVLGKLDPNTNPDCRPDQPPNVVRYTPGSTEGCDVPGYGAGKLTWRNKFEDYYAWDTKTRSWVLVTDTTAEVVDTKFTPYTTAELESKGCAKQPTTETVHESHQGCDLKAYGFGPGLITRDGTVTTTYAFVNGQWVGTPGAPVWGAWVYTAWSQEQLVANGCVTLPPPVVTPPVVVPPPVIVPPTDDNPIRLVSVNVKQRDRCGTVNDRFKVGERSLAIYKVKGKQVKPEGKWLKTKGAKRIIVKAMVDPGVDDVQLVGVSTFVLTFKNVPCKKSPPPPVHFPDTGFRFTSR